MCYQRCWNPHRQFTCFLQVFCVASGPPPGWSRLGSETYLQAHGVGRSSRHKWPLHPLSMDGRPCACLPGVRRPCPHPHLTWPVLPGHEGWCYCGIKLQTNHYKSKQEPVLTFHSLMWRTSRWDGERAGGIFEAVLSQHSLIVCITWVGAVSHFSWQDFIVQLKWRPCLHVTTSIKSILN